MSAILRGDFHDALLATPMRAHIEVPLRSVHAISPLLGALPVRGDLGLYVRRRREREGAPSSGSHPRAQRDGRAGLDARAHLVRHGGHLRRRAAARKVVAFRKADQLLDLNADLALRASDLIAGTAAGEANADASLTKFPIGAVSGFFDDDTIDGDLSGRRPQGPPQGRHARREPRSRAGPHQRNKVRRHHGDGNRPRRFARGRSAGGPSGWLRRRACDERHGVGRRGDADLRPEEADRRRPQRQELPHWDDCSVHSRRGERARRTVKRRHQAPHHVGNERWHDGRRNPSSTAGYSRVPP